MHENDKASERYCGSKETVDTMVKRPMGSKKPGPAEPSYASGGRYLCGKVRAGRLGYSETTSQFSLPGFRTIRLNDKNYCPLGGDIRVRM